MSSWTWLTSSPLCSCSRPSSRNLRSSISFSYLIRSEVALRSSSASRFLFAALVMFMALDANIRVPLLCSRCQPPQGEMVQIIAVLLFPPSACCSSLVSLESL